VVVLGKTGRNFAAGMSGGVAYVFDDAGDFETRCNREMVNLEALTDGAELDELKQMIECHLLYTGSERANHILSHWEQARDWFVKVIPQDYQRMMLAFAEAEAAGLTGDEAVMAGFEANLA
jgi:glutamate synthase (ferredoxin)